MLNSLILFFFYFQTLEVWTNELAGRVSAFTWDLMLKYIDPEVKEEDKHKSPYDPKPSVTLIGAFFAVWKDFFHEIGLMDPGDICIFKICTQNLLCVTLFDLYTDFDIWGGEDIELGLRTWVRRKNHFNQGMEISLGSNN